MCARPAVSTPSRTSTTGDAATSSATIADADQRADESASVVSIGASTSAAIGAATAALMIAHSDGLSRSR